MAVPEASEIAVSALSFIGSDDTLLKRFCAVTGVEIASLRAAASSPQFLPAVLDFVLAHEPTLIAFAEARDVDPAKVAAAHQALSPQEEDR